jgi:beta-glucosidase
MLTAAAGLAAASCSGWADLDPQPPTSQSPVKPALEFPDGFSWEGATSAYQIEGAVPADGGGRSIWDTFCERPRTIADNSSGAVACDHYHRWESDLDLLRSLRIGSYSFLLPGPAHCPKAVTASIVGAWTFTIGSWASWYSATATSNSIPPE